MALSKMQNRLGCGQGAGVCGKHMNNARHSAQNKALTDPVLVWRNFAFFRFLKLLYTGCSLVFDCYSPWVGCVWGEGVRSFSSALARMVQAVLQSETTRASKSQCKTQRNTVRQCVTLLQPNAWLHTCETQCTSLLVSTTPIPTMWDHM